MTRSRLLSGCSSKVPGGIRLRTAEESLAAIGPLLSTFGITRVANVTGMDFVGIPTVMVTRPNSRSLSVSQGKGADLVSAKVSGIFESVEQWHAERIALPLRLARVDELPSVIDVARLPRYVDEYEQSIRILWIEGEDLGTGLGCWVPFEMVHLDFTLPLPAGSGYFMPGSNGLASGASLVEATLHGACELIERDSLTLFYGLSCADQWQRRVDVDSVVDPTNRALLSAFDAAEIDVAVWDIASDLEVPAYLCSILERNRDPFRPVGLARGSGAHVDPVVALSRALTEAAQSRLTRIVGTRDDIQSADFARLRSEHRFEEGRRQLATPARPPRLFGSSMAPRATVEEDLLWVVERLAQAGMSQVVVVDLSRPNLPISVARVLVPGLEALSEAPGYHPGVRARSALAVDS